MNQKGISSIVIILIIVGVLVVGGGVWYWQNQIKQPTTPSITVISPNGREEWEIGKKHDIKWRIPADLPGGTMTISLIQSDTKKESVLFSDLAIDISTNYSVNWTIPDNISPGSYTISAVALINAPSLKGKVYKISDVSDAPFSIVVAGTFPITVLSPNGGETWQIGTTQTIRWTTAGSISKNALVDIYLVDDTCSHDEKCMVVIYITRGAPNTGSFNWTVGNYPGGTVGVGQYKIRVASADNNSIFGSSDALFSIVASKDDAANYLTCTLSNGTGGNILINSPATFSASGGKGFYNWSAPHGSPSSGTGHQFSTVYSTTGLFTVTVTSEVFSSVFSSTCNVSVIAP